MVEFQINQDGRVFKFEDGKPETIIGYIQNKIYKCQRDSKEHLHFLHDAWGISSSLLEELDKRGIEIIHINDQFFDDNYYSELSMLREFGIEGEYENGDKQIFLPRLYWGSRPDFLSAYPGYVQLHVHSEFSMLDGFGHLEEMILKARRMKMNAMAVTDHGNLFAIHKFHRLCKRAGIKPILGCEFYICDDIEIKARKRHHLVLLAKNETGYKNLITLSTLSHLKGFYYAPRIDKDMLLDHHEGLIALSACLDGYPTRMVLDGREELRIKEEIYWWRELFGEDYYIEIHPDSMEEYIKVNPKLIELAKTMGVEIVSTNDVHYVEKEDREAHNALLGIQKKQTLAEKPGFSSGEYWFKGWGDIANSFQEYHPTINFKDYERAMRNTQVIADKVQNFDIKGLQTLPKIKGRDLARELKAAYDVYLTSAEKSEVSVIKDVWPGRIEYELEVIKRLGFEDYFLLISDIITFAKGKGIEVGAGRGSVAGSLIAYLLGITEVDPLKHGLIFERFLNPGRKTLPDIDIDFDASRREEVIDYVRSKWNTAKISTYIAIQGKGSIKDCCRVCGIDYGIAERMSKSFPTRQTLNMTIDRAILTEPAFNLFYKEYPEMFNIARRLEGRIKTRGIHPAGVIISDEDISGIVAERLSEGSSGEPVIQCDMEDADTLGLLKVDILGAKTQTTLAIAKKLSGVKDMNKIPLNDKKVYTEFERGNCWDIFQFQSDLGHETVMKVKPKDFETLAAITALIRPGAYDFIDRFASNDYEPIMPELRPILKESRNIILYQEQAMRIAVDIAGFSLERADDLRKAIGKKKTDVMSKLRNDFVNGGVAKGFDEKIMMELFSIIERSSNYSFNKSHAIAYTLTSYRSMWFKVHHPIEWATAELTVQVEDDEKLERYINDALRQGIKILPPDINVSEWGFNKEGDAIRCGLGMVKGVSSKGYAEISSKKPYDNFLDFLNRISGVKCNRGAVQALIKAGAFDSFNLGRKPLFDIVEKFKKSKKLESTFSYGKEEWDPKEKSAAEKEVLGFYLSGHPILQYKEVLEKNGIDFQTGEGESGKRGLIKVAGFIDKVKPWPSKRGEMAFVDISGFKDYSICVWSTSWSIYKGKIKPGDMVIVQGRKLEDGGKLAIDTERGDRFIILK
jgi:DNA polymerase-3 subunit alpha